MTDRDGPRGRLTRRFAGVLLVFAAGALWVAARLPWVIIGSFDGLGPPRQATVSGATWSTALLPLALLALAAAAAVLAVRGWPLRILALLLATAGFAGGYLGASMWVIVDVAVRGATLAQVPLISLVGAERRYAGATITLIAAMAMVGGAVLLLRSASGPDRGPSRYTGRRSTARSAGASDSPMSEPMIWEAFDDGSDPTDEATDRLPETHPEGRCGGTQ